MTVSIKDGVSDWLLIRTVASLLDGNVHNNKCPNHLFSQIWSHLNFFILPARASEQGNVIGLVSVYIYVYYIPPPLTVHFSMMRSVRYQPILHTLYYTLHTEHAYCLSYRFLNNVVTTTIVEMVEMVEILDGRLGKHSVELVRYVINNLLHLVIVKYGDISLVLCISTRLRLVTILSLLVKYLVIFHADPCNKSYIYMCVKKKL